MIGRPLRVLVVATKSPWPSSGGGRMAVGGLVDALEHHGVAVRVVAPVGPASQGSQSHRLLRGVPGGPRSWTAALARAIVGSSAVISRYLLEPLAAAVDDEIARFEPDVVHLEQVHLGWLIPRLNRRVAVVLRQQNVESELLGQLATLAPPGLATMLRSEARALARFEGTACRCAHLVAAISDPDAEALRRIAPGARVEVLPPVAPWVGGGDRESLEGRPSFVCIGSFDWWPNRDGARWLVREVWPRIRAQLPDAMLHLAGPGSTTLGRGAAGIVHRGVVESSARIYDPQATALIPVRAGSGVRIRLLEAWAAGVPAVSTGVGAAGLAVLDGAQALVADSAADFANAAVRLATDAPLRLAVTRNAEASLKEYAPGRVAAMGIALYERAIARFDASSPSS